MGTVTSGLAILMSLAMLLGAAEGALAQEATTNDALLPGVALATEEVEPGVFHVISDGVRELARDIEFDEFDFWAPPGLWYRLNAAMGGGLSANEDGVWLRRPEGIIRLGDADLLWAPKEGNETPAFRVAADGTLYSQASRRILTDGTWKSVQPRVAALDRRSLRGLLVGPDGTLWVRGTNGKNGDQQRVRIARRDADGWSRVPTPPRPPQVAKGRRAPAINDWAVTADGVLYVRRDRDIQRFDGERWATLPRPGGRIDRLMVGADGTVWISQENGARLRRLGEDGWMEVEVTQRPRLNDVDHATVASDGAYWYTPEGDPLTTGGCDGVARVDGATTSQFLAGHCIYDIAAGPGGSVWLEASEWVGDYYAPETVGPVEVFAIAPDGMAVES